jgi:hypothetical protein
MLEDAYYKVLEENSQGIQHLKKEGNPEQYKAIYETYLDLEARQNAIKRVMPLQINGRNLDLKFNDYTSDIVDYRDKTSIYVIKQGITLLDSNDKENARKACDLFSYIERLNPNFENTRSLITEAHNKGTDYVMVSIENQTRKIIRKRLASDLLNFNTYGLNKFWTVYHAQHMSEVNYDFAIQLQLKRINISTEQVNSRQELKQKNIIDGWEYQTDSDGHVTVDSLGNNIKIDKIISVRARYFEVNQFKSTQVITDVVYTDLRTNQTLDAFSIDSEFIFEHFYATVRGDHRALNRQEHELTRKRRLFFPSDAQIMYDTGENIKLKLKDIISSYSIKKDKIILINSQSNRFGSLFARMTI